MDYSEDSIREAADRLRELIDASENTVFFGGAGVSTESGIPDFRSKNGLYNNRGVEFDRYPPEYLLSIDCLLREPRVFFEFYRQKLDGRKAKPNAAHIKLAELEKDGKLRAVVTQNIDSLHTEAGSRSVFEIHGSTARNYCMRCGKRYPPDFIFESEDDVPRCSCGGTVRCDVTLYGEQLPDCAVAGAVKAISEADLLIVGGTSLTVYPAASFLHYFSGRHLVLINLEHVDSRGLPVDLEINLPIGKVFAAL